MIDQTDILYIVSKFLDETDTLAYVTPNLFRLPNHALCRMGLATKFMASDAQCLEDYPPIILKTSVIKAENLVRAHTAPEKIADVILNAVMTDNFVAVLNGLAANPNWIDSNDDRLLAVKFLAAMNNNGAISDEMIKVVFDDKAMKRLCRFNQVLREYTAFLWCPLSDVMSYSHGRKIGEMYRWLRNDNENVKVLFNECATVDDLEAFLDAINDDGGNILTYLTHPLVTPDVLDRLVEKYN